MTEAAAGKPMKVTITNVYVPDTEVTFEAVKVFENGELNAGNIFTFDVSEETGTFISGKDQVHVSEAVTKDGTSDKKGSKGKITFQPIKYTLDDLKKKDGSYEDKKVFRYVIQERVPASADGNGYDSASQIKYDLTKKSMRSSHCSLTVTNWRHQSGTLTEIYRYSQIPRIRRRRQPRELKPAMIRV